MKTKHFIKVAQTYSPKNKLAEVIIKNLSILDGTLVDSKETAIRTIDTPFNSTLTTYLKAGGRAMLPNYKRYDINSGFGISIEDVIIINVFQVKQEL